MKQLLTITALLLSINLQAQHYQTASTGIITDSKLQVKNFFVSYGEGYQFKGWQLQAEGFITFTSGSFALTGSYDFDGLELSAGVIDVMELMPKYKIETKITPLVGAKIKVLSHAGISFNYADKSYFVGVYFKNFLNNQ